MHKRYSSRSEFYRKNKENIPIIYVTAHKCDLKQPIHTHYKGPVHHRHRANLSVFLRQESHLCDIGI